MGDSRRSGNTKAPQRFGPYQVGETIGRGTFAKVKVAVHEPTKVRVALKIIPRKVMETDAHSGVKIMREIKIMQVLKHPHITRLYDVVKTKHDIVLVMEFVSGGELFDYISRKGRLNEPTARALFQQISAAIAYCHRYRVTHRDIKPENIMLEHSTRNVKLSDFGLSSITHDGRFFETSCGTPNYASPEVVGGLLYGGPETDVWSCGVVLYAMLCGALPFDDDDISVLFRKIQTADYVLPSTLSSEVRDLISRMLVVNPLERATMEQVMQHPWMLPERPEYLVSLHYDAVVDAMCFAKDFQISEDMLDDEVVRVVASRFRISPQQVLAIVLAEEECIPSMRAVISEDHPGIRRYPAATYFENYSSVLDSKLWPTPVEIVAAEVALRDDKHDVYVSYCILTQRKQNKLGPEELANKSFGSNATSLLKSQSHQGYGSLHANSLQQLSANSSFTGSSLKESLLTPAPHSPKPKKSDATNLSSLLDAVGASTRTHSQGSVEDPWTEGFNKIAAPFLPLHNSNAKHTILGALFRVQEVPVSLLRSRNINLIGITKNLMSEDEAAKSATSPTATGGGGTLLRPLAEGSSHRGQSQSSKDTDSLRSASKQGQQQHQPQQRRYITAGEECDTALDVLYRAESVTRFGNDFMRNGVYFSNCTAESTLKVVYSTMKEEGLMWRVIYDFYFSAVRFPNVKLQIKIYKVSATEQIVDVKVSSQCGMVAYDAAISFLERLRTKQAGLRGKK